MKAYVHYGKLFLVLFFSLFTYVGGHCINRRLDRVVFFISLILIVFSIPALSFFLNSFFGINSGMYAISSYMVLSLWLISVLISMFDLVKPNISMQSNWSVIGITGAFIISIYMSALGIYYMASIPYFLSDSTEHVYEVDGSSSYSKTYSISNSDLFYHSVNFGGYKHQRSKRPEPPTGNATLAGRITYDGKPVANITLTLYLNGQYETKSIITDKQGHFKVNLPEGEWYVNKIQAERWDSDLNNDEYLLVSDYESILSGEKYYRSQTVSDEGIKFMLSSQAKTPVLNLYIKKKIDITWPGDPDNKSPADIAMEEITWSEYPNATKYMIKITKIDKKGDSTSYYPVTYKITDKNRFPLSGLVTAEHSGTNEYGVEITAFNGNEFLSESNQWTPDKSFTLLNMIVVDDKGLDILADYQTYSAQDIEILYQNRKRVTAIEILIDDEKLAYAEELLDEIKGPVDDGKVKALRGYLLAKKGFCDEARQLFSAAVEEGGTTCVPKTYRSPCSQ